MEIDVNGVVAYGVNLTEDQVYEIEQQQSQYDGIYEIFEHLFMSWEFHEAIYDGLLDVPFASYEYPDWVIAVKYVRSYEWEATVLKEEFLELNPEEKKLLKTLEKFCKDYNIPFEPKWYFGGQCS